MSIDDLRDVGQRYVTLQRKIDEAVARLLRSNERFRADADLLDRDERAWIDRYHADVRDAMGPLVEPEVRDWLASATRPLAG